MFVAAAQGTPHPWNVEGTTYDDYVCRDNPATYDPDGDGICGRSDLGINGSLITEDVLRSAPPGHYGTDRGTCAFWNGEDDLPAAFPEGCCDTSSRYYPLCTYDGHGIQAYSPHIEENILGPGDNLEIVMAGGRGCYPTCSWSTGVAIYRIGVR